MTSCAITELTAPLARGQSALMSPALIAIDWGSSSFRAYLMSPSSEILDQVASSDGIGSVAPGTYPATLKRLTGRGLDARAGPPIPNTAVSGSHHRWPEAPYVPFPAGPRAVAANLAEV